MLNVFLRDDVPGNAKSKTIIAKKGYIETKGVMPFVKVGVLTEQNFLVLFDGVIQTEKKNKKLIF